MAEAGEINTGQGKGLTSTNETHVSAITQRELSPVNGIVVFAGTVVGGVVTIATYFFGSMLPGYALVVCLGAWALALAWVLALLGRDTTEPFNLLDPKGWLACAKQGLVYARTHPRYSLLLLLMSAFAAFSGYVKLMEHLNPQRDADIKEIRRSLEEIAHQQGGPGQALLSPADRLRRDGMWNNQAFGEALLRAEGDTIRQYVAAGWNVTSGFEEGNALGHFAFRGDRSRPQELRVIVRELASQVDLTKPVAKFRGYPFMTMATVALVGCNAPLLQAMAAEGLKRPVHSFIVDVWGPTTHEPLDTLAKDKNCSAQDKASIRGLVEVH